MLSATGPLVVIGLWVLVVSVAYAAPKLKTYRPIDADAPAGFVRQIKVLADKAPDTSSREAIVRSVTRGCKTNDEKAIAIYNFFRLMCYHHAYPGEPGGIAALKLFNVYGWSLCGGQHSALSSLWVTAGWKHRFVGWKGHTTVEAFYDDQWHYFDTFLKFYCWKKDPNAPGGRTVARQADIANNPDLINKGMVYDKGRRVWYARDDRFEIIDGKANWTAPAFLVCGDSAPGVISGCKGRRPGRDNRSWMGIKHAEDGYNTNVNLGVGYSLELMWKPIKGAHWFRGRKRVPYHSCGDKDYRNCPAIGPVLEPYRYLHPRGSRTYANGRLIFAPDMSNDAFLTALAAKDNVKLANGALTPADPSKPASITVYFQAPYIFTRAKGSAEGVESAEISTDGGKTFKAIDLANFDDAVGGKYACLVRLGFKKALRNLRIEIIVQHNRCALPYLSPGPNKVTVSVADPKALGNNRLVVTYAYALGSRSVSYEELCDMGAEVARCHKASWSDKPTVVQKAFTAADLPATIDIPVPTPKGKYPVYPRMLFLRREVIAPGSKPMPLPPDALPAKVGPNQELKTLPNPFLIGTQKPPKRVERPKVTKKIPMQSSHVVWRTKDGKTADQYGRTITSRPAPGAPGPG